MAYLLSLFLLSGSPSSAPALAKQHAVVAFDAKKRRDDAELDDEMGERTGSEAVSGESSASATLPNVASESAAQLGESEDAPAEEEEESEHEYADEEAEEDLQTTLSHMKQVRDDVSTGDDVDSR